MKRFYRIALSVLSLFLVSTSSILAQTSGDSFEKAKQTRQANITYIYSEAPGFASAVNGQVQGVCVSIMEDFEFFLLDKYGIKVNSTVNTDHANNFTTYLTAVKKSTGGVFGLSNTTITEKRKKEYNFSPAYITNIAMLLTNKAVPTLGDISKIGDTFNGMIALTIKGTTNEDFIKQLKSTYYPTMKIEYLNYFDEAVKKLESSDKYFASMDFTYYLDGIQNNKPIKRHPAGDQAAEEFGIIMPSNSDWEKPFAEFLTEAYKSSASYRKIIVANLGPNALKLLDAVSAG
ncbi:MAG: ABC-type amino acid transport substrate-binding protein [Marivirga sp.]|jgi:ABC-type amino acid transport substrate-binding protein